MVRYLYAYIKSRRGSAGHFSILYTDAARMGYLHPVHGVLVSTLYFRQDICSNAILAEDVLLFVCRHFKP
jgi:hypothetical protein